MTGLALRFVVSLYSPSADSMAAASSFRFIIAISLLISLNLGIGAEIVLEEGYTVTTVIDGNKLDINPYSVYSLHGSSSDLIILDHVKSTFYTVSFSDSQVSEIKKLAGNGDAGYMDGDLGSAMFSKPKSFALDMKNNIYIADQANHVIRKISKSGVTTIAGGYTQKTGHADGPAQNASFSNNFELAFAPQRCALLISDRANTLVRQIDLKAEDCAGSSSGSVLGSTTAWVVGVGVACLIGGLIVGFFVRPYVCPYEASGHYRLSMTWKHCLFNLGKQAVTFYFVMRSAIASYKLYELLKQVVRLSLSQLSLVFGLNLFRSPPTPMKYVSLLDCDDLGSTETTKTQVLVNELNDLLALDGTPNPQPLLEQENAYRVEEKNDVFPETGGKIDRLIYSNFAGFVEGGKKTSSVASWEISS